MGHIIFFENGFIFKKIIIIEKNNFKKIIKEEIEEEEEGGVRRREKKMGSENKQTNKHPFFLPRRNWKPPEDEIVYNLLQLLIVGLPTI